MLTKQYYVSRILDHLDELDLVERANVQPNNVRAYVKRCCNGKPLSRLDNAELESIHAILENMVRK